MTDPVALLTAADTLLLTTTWVQPVTVPPELAPFFQSQSFAGGHCVTKQAGQLQFSLNSAQDFGFPKALSFDILFVGTVVQTATPTSNIALVRFDVDQTLQARYALPGLDVVVDTITGKIEPEVVSLTHPMAGTNCSGQPRTVDAWFAWLRGFATVPNPGVDLMITMHINGKRTAVAH